MVFYFGRQAYTQRELIRLYTFSNPRQLLKGPRELTTECSQIELMVSKASLHLMYPSQMH